MEPLSSFDVAVLDDILRRQPMTPAKLAFCWRRVVGAAVDRATRVHLGEHGAITVDVDDIHWKRELDRMLPEISRRLKQLLGDEMKRIAVRRRRESARVEHRGRA